jgi:prefoldin alpha subunit
MNKEELIALLGNKYEYSKELEEKIGIVDKQIYELQHFQVHLGEIDKNKEKEILASLGKGVFVKSEIKDDKLFVDVGSGVLIRKDSREAREVIEDQLRKLGEMRLVVQGHIEKLGEELQDLVRDIEKAG